MKAILTLALVVLFVQLKAQEPMIWSDGDKVYKYIENYCNSNYPGLTQLQVTQMTEDTTWITARILGEDKTFAYYIHNKINLCVGALFSIDMHSANLLAARLDKKKNCKNINNTKNQEEWIETVLLPYGNAGDKMQIKLSWKRFSNGYCFEIKKTKDEGIWIRPKSRH